jgi:hypothetical protein
MSSIQERATFVALTVSFHLGAFQGFSADMATDGEGGVFTFAGRTDHDRGWLDVSYAGDYPARLSPPASNIFGTSVETNTKRCGFPCAYRIDSYGESYPAN